MGILKSTIGRLFLLGIFILGFLCGWSHGQVIPVTFNHQFITTAVAADVGNFNIGTGLQYWQVEWTGSGTRTTCSLEVDSSVDNVNWNSADVFPSTSCTTNGFSGVITFQANYLRINVTALSGAGNTVNVVLTGGPNGNVDPCQNNLVLKSRVSLNALAANGKIISNVAGQRTYICGYSINATGTTPTYQFKQGTGTTCATNSAVISDVYTPVVGSTTVSNVEMVTTVVGRDVCIFVGGTPVIAGDVNFVQQYP